MGTPTNNCNLQQPTVGGETGTWGTNLNNNTIAPLDQLLGSVQALTVTSADVNITTGQFQNAVFNVTGGLTANRNLFVPVGAVSTTTGAGGRFIVTNNTSNNFTLTVNTTLSGAVGSVVPQGGRSFLYCDGTNVKTASFGDLSGAWVLLNSGNPNGSVAGTAGSTATGLNSQILYDATDNNLYVCTTTGTSATAVWTQPTVMITRGFDTAINLQLSAAVSSNTLTVSVLTSSGATPSAVNPVTVVFPDSTVANGDPTSVNVTGALSIATSSAGSTLGSQNGVSFRFWITAINNSGTAVLGLVNCVSSALKQFKLDEAAVVTTTAMSTSANTAGTMYTSSGVGALTNKAFRIIGYLTYETALVTAGTYNNAPDVLRLFGPGIKKPGDIIQNVFATDTSQTAVSSAAATQTATTTTLSITPNSKANLVFAQANGALSVNSNNSVTVAQISRGSGPTFFGSKAAASVGGSGVSNSPTFTVPLSGFDNPQTTTAQSYTVYITCSQGGNQSNSFWGGTVVGSTAATTSIMSLQEIMA